jgi:hypothetical protein
MIERLQRIATLLHPFRGLMLLLAGLACVLAGISLLRTGWTQADVVTIPALLLFSWSLTAFSLAGLFSAPVKHPGPGSSWHKRCLFKLHRAALWCLGLVMLGVGLTLLLLTWQLLRTWLVS